jgi:TPP-dependent pyruvate/acetoin dehydrogenase alpha subunit
MVNEQARGNHVSTVVRTRLCREQDENGQAARHRFIGPGRASAAGRAPALSEPVARTGRLPRERLLRLLGRMLLIRRFEEAVEERIRAGELPGFHVCTGQEAVPVGVCAALADDDVIGSAHRAHGHVLAKGTPPSEVMAELHETAEGNSRGYGRSMHGGGLAGMAGAALAFQLRREPCVAVALLGDGAASIGTSHESLNLAQLWGLPIVFVCEKDRRSESTPRSPHHPIADLTARALAFGMHALRVDGQDVEEVFRAARDAVAHARYGDGPVFLVCESERLRNTRDPVCNLRDRLEVGDEEWERMDGEARKLVVEAVAFARAGRRGEP